MKKKTFKPDRQQEDAIYSGSGQVLVIAGAGSGKTFTLTQKVKALVEGGASPHNILAFTFTRKGAEEMKARIGEFNLPGGTATVGTIHSVMYGYYLRTMRPGQQKPTILANSQEKLFVYRLLKDLNLPDFYFRSAISLMRSMKNGGMTIEGFTGRFDAIDKDRYFWFNEFASQYERRRKRENLMTFDDMLYDVYWLMKEGHSVKKIMQSRYHYVLVDEFQDINRVQFELIWMIQQLHKNLFAVGDMRQSVYGFRGSRPEFSLNFQESFFPDSRVIYLNNNYRSSKNIVDLGNRLISMGEWSFPDMISTRDGGDVYNLGHFPTAQEEAEAVVDQIVARSKELQWKQMAVLFRTNAQSRALEEECIKQGVPYYVENGFYHRTEVVDIVSYARVIAQNDYDSFFRILNRPNRYFGKKVKALLMDSLSRAGYEKIWHVLRVINNGSSMKQRAMGLIAHFKRWDLFYSSGMPVSEILNDVVKSVQYEKYLDAHFEDAEDRQLNVNELIESAKNFDNAEKWLAYVKMMMDKKQEALANSDRVVLLTIHKAKGLEWHTTFVTGVTDGVVPHRKSTDVEEERRMLYVALTRATDVVHVSSWAKFSLGDEKSFAPSRFLTELGMSKDIVEEARVDEGMYA